MVVLVAYEISGRLRGDLKGAQPFQCRLNSFDRKIIKIHKFSRDTKVNVAYTKRILLPLLWFHDEWNMSKNVFEIS